tara:strand:+ start:230 stop:436 length:207 start_codon:yes stop_codon:yes gene_type:complete
MKIKELFDYIDNNEGDLTFVKLDSNIDEAQLQGVCASSEDIQDFHQENPKDFPQGKYLVLRAVEVVEI